MSVKLLTKEDIEDAKNPGASKRKDRFSYFSRGAFQSDAGRGDLYLTTAPSDGDPHAKRPKQEQRHPGVVAAAFLQLSWGDKTVFIETTWKDTIARLKKPRRCASCNEAFTFFEELGRRRCAWHPGKVGLGDRWTCCGNDWKPEMERLKIKSGCSAADHNGIRPNPADRPTMRLALLLAIYAGVPRRAISDKDWVDKPLPRHECIIQIATTMRFANGFTYSERPFQSDIIERPLPFRAGVLKGGYIVTEDLMQLTYMGTWKPL